MRPGLETAAVLQTTQDGGFAPSIPTTAKTTRATITVGREERGRRGGILVDGLGLSVAAAAAAVAQALVTSHRHDISVGAAFGTAAVRLAVCVPVLVTVLSGSRHRARSQLRVTLAQQLHEMARPLAAGTLACLAGWRILALFSNVGPPPLDAMLLTCTFGLTAVALLRRGYYAPPARSGRRVRRVVILGSGLIAQRVASQLGEAGGVEVVGFLDDDPQNPAQCCGRLSDLSEVCEANDVHHVVVAFSRSEPKDMVEVLRPIEGKLPITVVPRLFDVLPVNANVCELSSGFPGIAVAPVGAGRNSRVTKRALDLAASAFGLILLSPFLLAIAVAIRLTSAGPILFRQTRIGFDGQEFSMFKFRTMYVQDVVSHPASQNGAQAVGPFPKLKDDPRVTAIGRMLRRRSLDELPQLFNVLFGTMSLVGPRPFIPEDAILIDGWAARRYAMPPGITGLWQVSGRNELTYDEMSRLDQLYVSHWSLLLDLRILFRTLRVVATGHGAY